MASGLTVNSKIILVIEYDGTRYHGFQLQANAVTIQEEVERALYKLTGKATRVAAASRTDAGVHAKGQVVGIRTESNFAPETWVKALNYHLPQDIAVKVAYMANDDFNVRHSALSREYRYCILNESTRSPMRRRFAYLFPIPLDVELMNYACQVLIGEHDFAPFASPLTALQRTTWRSVYKAEVRRRGGLVIFDMIANSFLPHQVRNTMGGLIMVGLGKIGVERVWDMDKSKKAGTIGPMAPAHGLFLMKVNYPSLAGDYRRSPAVSRRAEK